MAEIYDELSSPQRHIRTIFFVPHSESNLSHFQVHNGTLEQHIKYIDKKSFNYFQVHNGTLEHVFEVGNRAVNIGFQVHNGTLERGIPIVQRGSGGLPFKSTTAH